MSQMHITFKFGSQEIGKQENRKEHGDLAQLSFCHINSAQNHKFFKEVDRSTSALQSTQNDTLTLTIH